LEVLLFTYRREVPGY